MAYFGKRGTMSLLYQSDGAGGNFIYPIIFEMLDLNAVAGRPRPDEIPVMDRGNLNAYAHHVQGPDTPIIQPVTLTFSCMIDNTFGRTNLLLALCNAPRIVPWSINGTNLLNVNGTTMVINGAGSSVSTPPPYDTQQDRITVEVLFRGDPHATPGSDDYGHRFNEVWFQPGAIRLVEAPESYKFNVTGSIYGPISQITALSPGTNLTSYVAT
jgi:hypothetical protein